MKHRTNEWGIDCCPNCGHTLLYSLLTSFPPKQQYSCDHCGYLEIDGKVINEGESTHEKEDNETISITSSSSIQVNDDTSVYTIINPDNCPHSYLSFAYAGTDGLHYHCSNCGKDIVTTWYELIKPTVDKIIEEHKNGL